ncbi:MAG: type II toxin-antitoxin system VapC family toxin [Solirubrobacterales bacterium]|nr:type II toxin-antitoxin system VapC family toxin [Solirubrobacterales bacterium]
MILPDVNILVSAFREDAFAHKETRAWLEARINEPAAYGVADRALEGFIRIVTHPRVFNPPSELEAALEFAELLTSRENCVRVNPGPRHWDLFLGLAAETDATGNQVADAWLAALAIESGSEWITRDRGFARYPKLSWRDPGNPRPAT